MVRPILGFLVILLSLPSAQGSDRFQNRLVRASQLVAAERVLDLEEAAGLTEKNRPALDELGLHRFYQVGDRWRVLHSATLHNLHEHRDIPASSMPRYNRPIAYDFQVVRVAPYTAQNGAQRRYAEIEVTVADESLERTLRSQNSATRITVVLNDLFRGLYKIYHLPRPRKDGMQRVVVGLDGRRNITSGLDRFPIDLPNVSRAYGSPTPQEPFVPTELRSALGRDRILYPASSLTFRYANNVGRKLEVIWSRQGLWPVYTASEAGIAVLAWEEKAGR